MVFSIISGLVFTKPTDEKMKTSGKYSKKAPINQVVRQAELSLGRYYQLIDSETDDLVHALLRILMNNPKSFPMVPHRALNIALRNFEQKMGQNDVEVLSKSLLLAMEENAQNKTKPSSSSSPSFRLTEEMKDKIENTLDSFFEDHV